MTNGKPFNHSVPAHGTASGVNWPMQRCVLSLQSCSGTLIWNLTINEWEAGTGWLTRRRISFGRRGRCGFAWFPENSD
jgi:hypothetical protein